MKNTVIAAFLLLCSMFSHAAFDDVKYNVIACSGYDESQILVFVQNLETGDVGTHLQGWVNSNKFGVGSDIVFRNFASNIDIINRGDNVSCAMSVALSNRVEIPIKSIKTN